MTSEFSPNARPVRPGSYFDFQAEEAPPQVVNSLGVVGLPFVHSWGPENQIVVLDSFSDFLLYYGQGGTTPPEYTAGYKAVLQCFTGEGLPGRGGAGQILAYRMVGSSGQAASGEFTNTSSADAITLTAKYKGSFGDQISVAVVATPSNPTAWTDLNIYVQGNLTETWTETNGDIAGLVSMINDPATGSKWVTATLGTDGTPLELVSTPMALTGGDDGDTLVASDWTNAMAAYGTQRFAVWAGYDLEDQSITASVLSWIQGLNAAGKRCMLVTGGPTGETATGPTSATSRAAALNDPNVVTIGVGTYNDSTLGQLNTAQLAPRLAGIIAARTDAMGLSFARLAGLSILSGPSDNDILTGISNGFMTIGQDSNPQAPVRFEKGITTFTSKTDQTRPYKVYSNPKFVLTMQAFENAVTEWSNFNVVGMLPVNSNTINYVIGNISARMKVMESDAIIQAGWTVKQATNPPPTPQDDFIALQYTMQFTRDVEQVLNTVVVG